MPTAKLKLDQSATDSFWVENGAIPGTINTPSGVFLVEIQGTVQVGKRPLISGDLELTLKDDDDEGENGAIEENPVPVGAVERQLGYFDFSTTDENNEVTLVIGKHQRLRGKISKMNPPMALIELEKGEEEPQRTTWASQSQRYQPGHDESAELEIPVLEIITHKIVFDSRPEPVT
ncbi:hypothetical protein TRICI_006582 [Trichomonascus ciferrii]|uniref:Chromosome transmission fidelity protein 8 n=1 Tax=Trichomonascus ciferrii TaxID=44093 RepID=A0A642UG83_9ASCO|nr:hypothetical protein TRICI_006582 [Trichomonascus ciferrii]